MYYTIRCEKATSLQRRQIYNDRRDLFPGRHGSLFQTKACYPSMMGTIIDADITTKIAARKYFHGVLFFLAQACIITSDFFLF
jgi:hypothetical protein